MFKMDNGLTVLFIRKSLDGTVEGKMFIGFIQITTSNTKSFLNISITRVFFSKEYPISSPELSKVIFLFLFCGSVQSKVA